MQNAWNWVDFFLLLIDLLRLRTYTGNKEKILRAMTSFRGFRVMVRQQSLRELVTALLKTLGPVATLFLLGKHCLPAVLTFTSAMLSLIVCRRALSNCDRRRSVRAAFSLFIVFAILAIRLFGDKLYYCNDRSVATGREDCFGNFIVPGTGIFMPRAWVRPDYNFDSLGKVSPICYK